MSSLLYSGAVWGSADKVGMIGNYLDCMITPAGDTEDVGIEFPRRFLAVHLKSAASGSRPPAAAVVVVRRKT